MKSDPKVFLLLIALCGLRNAAGQGAGPTDPAHAPAVIDKLHELCVDCHGPKKQKTKFFLHDINPAPDQGKDIERWEKILEVLSIGDMPPEDEDQPTTDERRILVEWITAQLRSADRGPIAGSEDLPGYGNRVNHKDLFSGEYKGPAYTRSRLWRISPEIYQWFSSKIQMAREFNAPLQIADERGIRDYATLYADEATIMTMLQNCKRAAVTLLHGTIRSDNNRSSTTESVQGGRSGSRHEAFDRFIKAEGMPKRDEMDEVLAYAMKLLLDRAPTEEDGQRYVEGFLAPNVELAGREAGLTGMLTTLMMSPEFLFRMELGLGEELPDGRRMLSPRELAYALSYAFFDYVEPGVLKAADEGRLETREDVEREFRRMMTEPDRRIRGAVGNHVWVTGKGAGVADADLIDASYPRMLRFFREFFGYVRARDVFKDLTRHDGKHDPEYLVRDADWFVLNVLREDHHVFEELLTSNRYPVQTRGKAIKSAPVYNLDQPTPRPESTFSEGEVPVPLPEDQRAGMLTHPAWLSAFSGNFETDPVRRGKWIREKLLAGVVPDLPIGVAAQLPEEPDHTIRQRFRVVREEECWRCHKKMNPLGEIFEAYDDFGRFRTSHLVGDDGNIVATEFEAHSRLRSSNWRDSHRKNDPPEQFKEIPVDTSGKIDGTADPSLEGDVSGPVELMHRLAASDLPRQSFIRHVFRYWMGRNETLDDSPTLMAMDKAYLESEGSFKELLVALITSDSFLYRK